MDMELIASELRKIENRDGTITPTAVEKTARPKSHPLHGHFEWDNSIAGYNWRLQQARHLIGSVKVIIQNDDREITSVAYVRDPAMDSETQGYRRITRLAETGDARAAVLSEFDRAESHLVRAHSIAIALDFASEIDKVIERLAKLATKIRKTAPLAEAA